MQKGVERHFSVKRETRPTDVDVLTAPHGIRANEEPDRFGPMSAGGISGGSMSQVTSGDVEDLDALRLSAVMSIAAHGSNQARMRLDGSMNMTCMHHTMTMTELCGTFESALERPLLDETGVSGEYAIRFHTPQPISPATFLGSLCERLGLKTSAARRDLSILVVRER
jgi:uncharacterized protein (TIGR03435 family)